MDTNNASRRSFLDIVDRFSQTATSIYVRAQHNRRPAGHFTSLLLDTREWTDVIREADSAERGLFTYVPPGTKASGTAAPSSAGPVRDILRKEVVSSTPLRKARNPANAAKPADPEEFLGAALKLIDE